MSLTAFDHRLLKHAGVAAWDDERDDTSTEWLTLVSGVVNEAKRLGQRLTEDQQQAGIQWLQTGIQVSLDPRP